MALLWQKGNKKGADADKGAKAETKAVAVKAAKPVKAAKEGKAEKRAAAAAGVSFPRGSAVIGPRITEKAGILGEKGIYTFNVRVDASVATIAKAVEDAYKVNVTAVRTAAIKSKAMVARGKRGRTVAGKKAYVSLKKGEKIEII